MKVKTQSKKVNKAWLNDHINDTYVKLAQQEGYRARAAYKLRDRRALPLPPGQGWSIWAARRAWSQYVRRRLGGTGTMCPDLLPMEPVEGALLLGAEMTWCWPNWKRRWASARSICGSDMAPNLSGIAATDTTRISLWRSWPSTLPATICRPTGRWWPKCLARLRRVGRRVPREFRLVKPFKPGFARQIVGNLLVGVGLKP